MFFLTGIDSDIIDEAIYYFKANVFFKNYEIKVMPIWLHHDQSYLLCSCCRSSTHASFFVAIALCSTSSLMLLNLCLCLLQNEADRTLIYVTLYITECLKKFQKVSRNICSKHICFIFTCVPLTYSSSKTHNSDQSQLKVWFLGEKRLNLWFIGRKDLKFLDIFPNLFLSSTNFFDAVKVFF